ncbi:hypothetical protein [Novosphingobium aromaticivorans]|nr:hypothetical protein [Novosphingobium aromaticivorans]
MRNVPFLDDEWRRLRPWFRLAYLRAQQADHPDGDSRAQAIHTA